MNFLKEPYLKLKDYSVTGEAFELLIDEELQLLKTYPQPTLDVLPKYYESDAYISHSTAKNTFFEKVYNLVRNKTIKKKLKLIQHCNVDKGLLLDIGTGTGEFLAEAKKQSWKTYGIEPSEKAKSSSKAKGLCIAEGTKGFEDNFFDVITMWHVLEHVPNLEEQIAELKRIIKPTGTIVIAVPNFKSFDAKYYGKYWAAFDVPRHLWHFSKHAIQELFSKEKLKVVDIKPMLFDSFYVSLLSEKYKNNKLNLLKAFYIGLRSNLYGGKNKEFSSHIYVIKNK
ncbi:class I SAM-dependent methyltransferase [Flavobacterium sp. UBA6135]|uniref:class I SAM-dependent methyltransferase n=1 Tax=Flavobacterium sp. UBA6135 TaxID=1946553 RepID=UPI0025C34F01|nr:class I SAM-dependent methyltransferase [Flavobacterium sp. UBA6135]